MPPTKQIKQAAPGIPASVLAAQVDELGALDKALAPWQLKIARVEVLKKAIRAHFDASPGELPFEARGDHYVVMLGHKAIVRSINPAKLVKAIGLKIYASIARVTLGDLEANVDPAIVAGCVTSANSGSRSLKIFEKGAS